MSTLGIIEIGQNPLLKGVIGPEVSNLRDINRILDDYLYLKSIREPKENGKRYGENRTYTIKEDLIDLEVRIDSPRSSKEPLKLTISGFDIEEVEQVTRDLESFIKVVYKGGPIDVSGLIYASGGCATR